MQIFASSFPPKILSLSWGWEGSLPQPQGRVCSFYPLQAMPAPETADTSINSLWFAYRREWSRGTYGLLCLSLGAIVGLSISSWGERGVSLSSLLSCPKSFSWTPKKKTMKKAYEWVQTFLVSGTPSYCEMLTHNYQECKVFSDCFAAYKQSLLCSKCEKDMCPLSLKRLVSLELLNCFATPVIIFFKSRIFRLQKVLNK